VASARRSRSRGRTIVDLLVFVVIVAVGGAGLVPLWHFLHPEASKASTAVVAATRAASPAASPGSRQPALQPDGVMFDDFHYTGSDDPALQAHGWQIRTDPGGPGIQNTWTTSGISFPTVASAQGGQVLQLQLKSNGTKGGTQQTELKSSQADFYTGTYAARVYFTDAPAVGPNGDHINEAFYAISPATESAQYSELDYEYMPNGGWGSARPELDTTSWHSSRAGDRVYSPLYSRIHGWHTLMITSLHGETTYWLDDHQLFTNGATYSPRQPVDVAFSTWLIDLPFAGQRDWNMQVNWFYYHAGQVQSLHEVQQAVQGYYAKGSNYVNTLTGS